MASGCKLITACLCKCRTACQHVWLPLVGLQRVPHTALLPSSSLPDHCKSSAAGHHKHPVRSLPPDSMQRVFPHRAGHGHGHKREAAAAPAQLQRLLPAGRADRAGRRERRRQDHVRRPMSLPVPLLCRHPNCLAKFGRRGRAKQRGAVVGRSGTAVPGALQRATAHVPPSAGKRAAALRRLLRQAVRLLCRAARRVTAVSFGRQADGRARRAEDRRVQPRTAASYGVAVVWCSEKDAR